MPETSPETSELRLLLELETGADEDELDLLTRELRRELIDQGVDYFEAVSGEPIPQGAKAVDPITIGALALAVTPVLLPKLIEFLNSWTMRAENRKIKIKTQVGDRSIELEYSPSAISEEELMKLTSRLTKALVNKPGNA
jgi:hypothetical protein